jgi:hypothetical protein
MKNHLRGESYPHLKMKIDAIDWNKFFFFFAFSRVSALTRVIAMG